MSPDHPAPGAPPAPGRFPRNSGGVPHGVPTTLSNLLLVCTRHHRAVHEEGYQVERRLDGALRFRRPDGQFLPEVPPPPEVPADPAQALREQHEAQGLHLDARTTTPGWLGERLNVGWAIDVLHPRANPRPGRTEVEGTAPDVPGAA